MRIAEAGYDTEANFVLKVFSDVIVWDLASAGIGGNFDGASC